MNRRMAIVLGLAGAAAMAAPFWVPADFAWNGLNTFRFSVATSRYASGYGPRLAWFGFAAAVLYPYVWALAAGIAMAMEWRGPSKAAPLLPAVVTGAGCALTAFLGVLLLLRRETWPAPAIQWTAVVGSCAHVAVLGIAVRRASPERRAAAAVLVGSVPFLFVQMALAVSSVRYGGPVSGFVLGAAGVFSVLSSSGLRTWCSRGSRPCSSP
jgi:hypothetical protein